MYAQMVNPKDDNDIRNVPCGFSWSTLFLCPITLWSRGLRLAAISSIAFFVLSLLVSGWFFLAVIIYHIVWATHVNLHCVRTLIEEDWYPADPTSECLILWDIL